MEGDDSINMEDRYVALADVLLSGDEALPNLTEVGCAELADACEEGFMEPDYTELWERVKARRPRLKFV